MSRAELKRDAKEKLKGNWGTVIIVIIIVGAITFFCNQAVMSSLPLSFHRNSSLLFTLFCTLLTSWKAFCINIKNTCGSCFPPLSF